MSNCTIEVVEITRLLAEAKHHYAIMEGDRIRVEHGMKSSVWEAWEVGQRLNSLKPLVGNGNWMEWLEHHWTGASYRTANRCMGIYAKNPEARSVKDLGCDAVRKFRLGFVPEKERPELDGDERLQGVAHQLGIVNAWRKMERARELGQLKVSDDDLRRDLAPLHEWLDVLFGSQIKQI
jgi:hypothetical protein